MNSDAGNVELRVPGFEKEVRKKKLTDAARGILTGKKDAHSEAMVDVKLPDKLDPSAVILQTDFIRQIQERTRNLTMGPRRRPYKSMVAEFVDLPQALDFSGFLEQLLNLFSPARPLRPTRAANAVSASTVPSLHVNVLKLYNVPKRLPVTKHAVARALEGQYGGKTAGPEPSDVAVQLRFTNLDGDTQEFVTNYPVQGVSPDVHHHAVFGLTQSTNLLLSPEVLLSSFLKEIASRNPKKPAYSEAWGIIRKQNEDIFGKMTSRNRVTCLL